MTHKVIVIVQHTHTKLEFCSMKSLDRGRHPGSIIIGLGLLFWPHACKQTSAARQNSGETNLRKAIAAAHFGIAAH